MLHPEHGTLIMNIHGGFLPNPLQQLRARLSNSSFAGAGFDPASSQGAEVLRLVHLYRSGPMAACFAGLLADVRPVPDLLTEQGCVHACRDALLQNGGSLPGAAYVVKALRQFNVALMVSRGLQLGPDPAAALAMAARSVGKVNGMLFDAAQLAVHRLWQLQ